MKKIAVCDISRQMVDFKSYKILDLNQNRHTNLLDLFVRESIQNSLDAAEKDAVSVDFTLAKFNRTKLSEVFQGLESLWSDVPDEFLSVGD